jgi:hypothetical protein
VPNCRSRAPSTITRVSAVLRSHSHLRGRAGPGNLRFVDERFEYAAWFRDSTVTPDDQDYEWPAMFVVTAPSAALAKEWGDRLATSFSSRRETEEFLWSSVEVANDGPASRLPVVAYGEDATDEFIGW